MPAARVELAPAGPERAAALARIAEPLLETDLPRAAELLERARAEDPEPSCPHGCWRRRGGGSAGPRRSRRSCSSGRSATRTPGPRAPHAEAAGLLSGSPDAGDRARAAQAWSAVFDADPSDLGAARAASDLLLSLDRSEEALPLLAALVRADPDDEPSARELADAFAGRHRERAELFLSRAEHAAGQPRAQRLREAARALFAAGEDRRARQVLRDAFDAFPSDDDAFFAAIRDAAADIDRLDDVLAARARAVPATRPAATAPGPTPSSRSAAPSRRWRPGRRAPPRPPRTPRCWRAGPTASRRSTATPRPPSSTAGSSRSTGRARACSPGALEAPSRHRLGLPRCRRGVRPRRSHTSSGRSRPPRRIRAPGMRWPPWRRRAPTRATRAARSRPPGAASIARWRSDRPTSAGRPSRPGSRSSRRLDSDGLDAATLLEHQADLRAEDGAAQDELEPLVRRAAVALRSAGSAERATALLARTGLTEAAAESQAVAVDPDALAAILADGPGADGWSDAAAALAAHYLATGEFREAASIEARRADAATEPADRAKAWLRSAQALEKAGAPPEEVDAAVDIAAGADPDSAEPWLALAAIEHRRGDLVAAARAHLSVSIRAEGEPAARSALQAARLFEQTERHQDAARAYRAAVLAQPGCVPARRVLAEEALAAGDVDGAAEHLLAIAPDEVAQDSRAEHRRTVARTLEAADRAAEAEEVWLALFREAPGDVEAFEHVGRLTLTRTGLDPWLDLAAEHEAALAACGETTRRRDLRHQRGTLFAGAGRLEAARGAHLSTLELDPGHVESLDALGALDGRKEEWRLAAEQLGAEAERATVGVRGGRDAGPPCPNSSRAARRRHRRARGARRGARACPPLGGPGGRADRGRGRGAALDDRPSQGHGGARRVRAPCGPRGRPGGAGPSHAGGRRLGAGARGAAGAARRPPGALRRGSGSVRRPPRSARGRPGSRAHLVLAPDGRGRRRPPARARRRAQVASGAGADGRLARGRGGARARAPRGRRRLQLRAASRAVACGGRAVLLLRVRAVRGARRRLRPGVRRWPAGRVHRRRAPHVCAWRGARPHVCPVARGRAIRTADAGVRRRVGARARARVRRRGGARRQAARGGAVGAHPLRVDGAVGCAGPRRRCATGAHDALGRSRRASSATLRRGPRARARRERRRRGRHLGALLGANAADPGDVETLEVARPSP